MHVAHMTMPFSRPGSAVTNVVRNLVREHDGPSTVITSHNRDVEVVGADNLKADFTGSCPRQWFDRTEMVVDHLFGFFGRERPFTGQIALAALVELRERKPDVIFVHEGHYASSGLPLFRRWFPATKIFLYVHTAPARAYTAAELDRLLAHADGVVCVSEYIVKLVRSRLGKYADRIRCHAVVNGVDTSRFSPPEVEPPASSLLYVGTMIPDKGPDLAIQAARQLGAKVQLRCLGSSVHGKTQDLSAFERRLHELAASGGGTNVEFQPFLPNDQLPGVYRSAGIVVVPSRFQDPCPLVCLEALSSGCAVVGTSRGGIPAICGDAALIVEPDPEQIRAALLKLVENRELYLEYRRRARERALDLQWRNQHARLMEVVRS